MRRETILLYAAGLLLVLALWNYQQSRKELREIIRLALEGRDGDTSKNRSNASQRFSA